MKMSGANVAAVKLCGSDLDSNWLGFEGEAGGEGENVTVTDAQVWKKDGA